MDTYLLTVLNSPLLWWHNWCYLPHMKDEALSPATYLLEHLPVAEPTDKLRSSVESVAARLVAIKREHQNTRRELLDWLKAEHEVRTFSAALQEPILKRFFSRSPSTSAPSSSTTGDPKESRARGGSKTTMNNPWYEVTGPDVRLTQGDIILECPLLKWQLDDAAEGEKASGERLFKAAKAIESDNAAYRLTPNDVRLMWETAPPRMPIADL